MELITKEELIKLFIVEQKSAPSIATIFGCTTNHVYAQLSKHGIRKNKPRVTDWFNKQLSNLIDEEIYLLGFLWADGYLSNLNRNLQCEILYDDFIDLEKIFDKVGKWGRYIRKASFKEGVSRKTRMLLTISDVKLVDKFISLDFDKKGLASPNKILKIIPKNKQYLFYRGYSDGDGCFYITDKAKHFFIGSTYDQDWSHIEKLYKRLKINHYNIQKKISKLGHKHSIIRISSLDAISKIAQYLYQNRLDLGLKRKYEKIKNYC
jgi:intein/homing endonuclease